MAAFLQPKSNVRVIENSGHTYFRSINLNGSPMSITWLDTNTTVWALSVCHLQLIAVGCRLFA